MRTFFNEISRCQSYAITFQMRANKNESRKLIIKFSFNFDLISLYIIFLNIISSYLIYMCVKENKNKAIRRLIKFN